MEWFDSFLQVLTANLSQLLLWTGIGVAMLAVVVVAPEAPINLSKTLVRMLSRLLSLRRQNVRLAAGLGTLTLSGSGSGYADVWNPEASVDERIRMLRESVIQLQRLLADAEARLSARLDKHQASVSAELADLKKELRELTVQVERSERRSSSLDARGFLPIGLGILLSGAPDELAGVQLLGSILLTLGFVTAIVCLFILISEYRRMLGARGAQGQPANS